MPTLDDADARRPGSAEPNGDPELFRNLFEAIPSPALIVDRDVRILSCNSAAVQFAGAGSETVLHHKGGDAFRCLESAATPYGCGHSSVCRECVIRNSVGSTFRGVGDAVDGGKVSRQRTRLRVARAGELRELYLLVSASPMVYRGTRSALLILEDISELVALQGLLPICAWCHRIRGTDRYWQSLERYLQTHADVDFTHSICEECSSKLIAEAKKDP